MKLTKTYLRKIIKEELEEATRGPHDRRAPTEPVYNRETEKYIIDDFEDLRSRVKALEDGIEMIIGQLTGRESQ